MTRREPVVLGIDLGTSSLKLLAMTRLGKLSPLVSVPITSHVDGALHEQDPEEWWHRLRSAYTIASSRGFDLSRIEAIGLTGHMHGAVLIDAAGHPMRRCITWADTRARAEADELRRDHGASYSGATMNDVDVVFTAPTYLWLTRHECETVAGARWLVSPKDFLRARLTGVWATDRTDAAGTQLFDVIMDRWSKELLDSVGLRSNQMPNVLQSGDIAGRVNRPASEATGLPEGIPVVAGGGDVPCATLGAGMTSPGEVYINVGTAAQVLSIHNGSTAPSQYWMADVSPERSIHCRTVFGAGLAHSAIVSEIAIPETESPAGRFQMLDDLARRIPFGADGQLFIPHHRAGDAGSSTEGGGTFVGASQPAMHRYRAVLEGVALAIESLVPPGTGQIRIGGGIRRSDLWLEIVASVLEKPIRVVDRDASPAGAAMLAGVAVGWFSSLEEATKECDGDEQWIDPVPIEGLAVMKERFADRVRHLSLGRS